MSVCRRLEVVSENEKSLVSKRMFRSVEVNSHRYTPTIVSDVILLLFSLVVVDLCLSDGISRSTFVSHSKKQCTTGITNVVS